MPSMNTSASPKNSNAPLAPLNPFPVTKTLQFLYPPATLCPRPPRSCKTTTSALDHPRKSHGLSDLPSLQSQGRLGVTHPPGFAPLSASLAPLRDPPGTHPPARMKTRLRGSQSP